MPDIFSWNENQLGQLIAADLEGRLAHLGATFAMPSHATLAKLARWGKAAALWELRRLGPAAAKPAVAEKISQLYVGMEQLRKGFIDAGIPVPNDETRARLAYLIGIEIINNRSEEEAGQEIV